MADITMKDIAQVMGVSVMTVSNAFNRPDQLSDELRRRILRRAQKMGYAGPHATARALRQGHANAYGVVFAEQLSHAFSDPFATLWLAGFSEVMERQRASITLLSVPEDDAADLRVIRNIAVDGIAGMCATHPAMTQARRQGLPVVAGDRATGDWVAIDERAAATEVTEHVRALGHTRICLVMPRPTPRHEGAQRLTVPELRELLTRHGGSAYLSGWERVDAVLAGLAGCEVSVLLTDRIDRQLTQEGIGLVLDRADRPTAVIAIADAAALGVLDGLRSRGLTPGRDVTVVGFDDLPGTAEAAGLTTVHQPIREKGALAAELLLDPQRQPRSITLPHRLVVRSSSGPAVDPTPPTQRPTPTRS